MSLDYKILGQELVSYTGIDSPGLGSYYASYEEVIAARFIGVGSGSGLYYSQDGISWESSSTVPGQIYGIGSNQDKFVVVGARDSISYSTDGLSWTKATFTGAIPLECWSEVVYGGDRFVAVSNSSHLALYSIDGENWTESSTPYMGYSAITYGDNKFVAMRGGSGQTVYSADGITWTASALPTNGGDDPYWFDITFGGDKFVAVSTSDAYAWSYDGINWNSGTLPSNNFWYSIGYGNGKFIGLNQIGIGYSTDGLNWSISMAPNGALPPGESWRDVIYGDGIFVAVTSSSAAVSTDGINWSGFFKIFNAPNYIENLAYKMTPQLVETLNIIGGQGTTQTEEFLPVTIYTVPENKQTTVTSIFVANHNESETTYDLAVVPAGEELSLKHHIRWDMPIAAGDFESLNTKITMSAGDKLVIFPSTVDTVSITAFGVEK